MYRVLLFKNLKGALNNAGILNVHDTAVRTRLNVELYQLTVFVIMRSKVISNCLFFNAEFGSNP